MGMSSGGGDKKNVSSDINVTPLIDVLLVLLIIFLVVMPIMMKMETLNIPRKLDNEKEMPDPNASLLTVKVRADLNMVLNDGNTDSPPVQISELMRFLKPKLDAQKTGTEKVVFVDFDEGVQWRYVVETMDQIRSAATDENHDEVKVALKIQDEQKQQ